MLLLMPEPLIVSIAELRTALLRALDMAKALLGPEVELDVDYYWHLPAHEAFNMTTENFTVGTLSDDLLGAFEDAHERAREEAWHDLSHLIGILRTLELAARG